MRKSKTIICGIYKITSPSNSVYIGQSKDILNRFHYYKYDFCKSQTRLYNSFKKYGRDRHKFEILTECNDNELDEMEVYFIGIYKSFKSKLDLNLESSGNKNKKLSEETKMKISIANKGKVITKETRDKLRLINLGKKHSPETIKKMSNSQKGKTHSEETRARLSASNRGKVQKNKFHKLTPEKACQIREMYKSGNYKQRVLAKMFGVSRPSVSNICRTKGKIWKNGI